MAARDGSLYQNEPDNVQYCVLYVQCKMTHPCFGPGFAMKMKAIEAIAGPGLNTVSADVAWLSSEPPWRQWQSCVKIVAPTQGVQCTTTSVQASAGNRLLCLICRAQRVLRPLAHH